jgi:hypothetical protein
MKPKNILSRSAGLCLLLSVVMALTSCGVWEWMWARRTEPEVNTNQLTVFFWQDGDLVLYHADGKRVRLEDPGREFYLKLCRQQGIAPVDPEG